MKNSLKKNCKINGNKFLVKIKIMKDNNQNNNIDNNMDNYFKFINETLNLNSMDIDDDVKSKTEKKNSNNLKQQQNLNIPQTEINKNRKKLNKNYNNDEKKEEFLKDDNNDIYQINGPDDDGDRADFYNDFDFNVEVNRSETSYQYSENQRTENLSETNRISKTEKTKDNTKQKKK